MVNKLALVIVGDGQNFSVVSGLSTAASEADGRMIQSSGETMCGLHCTPIWITQVLALLTCCQQYTEAELTIHFVISILLPLLIVSEENLEKTSSCKDGNIKDCNYVFMYLF